MCIEQAVVLTKPGSLLTSLTPEPYATEPGRSCSETASMAPWTVVRSRSLDRVGAHVHKTCFVVVVCS